MNMIKRFRVLLRVVPIVAFLIVVKAAIHAFDLEFIAVSGLVPSLVAGAIFITGFLLSHVLADYKEAERMPGEIRLALEAIHDDVSAFAGGTPDVDVANVRRILTGIVAALENGLAAKADHSDLKQAIAQVDELSPVFAYLGRLGLPQQYMVRLRSEQDILRRCLFRIYYIQKMQFVPSVHVLVQTITFTALVILLFLRTEALFDALIFGFVGFMFVYALFLIQTLEQPFRKGVGTVDDVSIFLLREFTEKIGRLR